MEETKKKTFLLDIPPNYTKGNAIKLSQGEVMFIVGANGTGKSNLMLSLEYSTNIKNIDWVRADRKIDTSGISLSNIEDRDIQNSIRQYKEQSRKRILEIEAADQLPPEERMKKIWKLRQKYDADGRKEIQPSGNYESSRMNSRPRKEKVLIIDNRSNNNSNIQEWNEAILAFIKIYNDQRFGDKSSTDKTKACIDEINEIFQMAKMSIEVFFDVNSILMVKNKNHPFPYNVDLLSDGERNVFLLYVRIITAKEDTLFLIDEPERHLHRSITSPLFSALFKKRKDCAFVISTHDLSLPLDFRNSETLLLRQYTRGYYRDSKTNLVVLKEWDTKLLKRDDDIPDDIKEAILGTKRKILFVEGKDNSLDRRMYEKLFPSVNVVSKGGCEEVMRCVQGARAAELDWVKVFGLIDSDGRSKEEITQLQKRGIYVLDCYSIESLYYHDEIVKMVAKVLGRNNQDAETALEKARKAIQDQKDWLCSLRVKHQIKNEVLQNLSSFLNSNGETEINTEINLKKIKKRLEEREASQFSSLEINDLIARYSVKNTGALSVIAKSLGLDKPPDYQHAVIQLLSKDEGARNKIKDLLGDISQALEEESAPASSTP